MLPVIPIVSFGIATGLAFISGCGRRENAQAPDDLDTPQRESPEPHAELKKLAQALDALAPSEPSSEQEASTEDARQEISALLQRAAETVLSSRARDARGSSKQAFHGVWNSLEQALTRLRQRGFFDVTDPKVVLLEKRIELALHASVLQSRITTKLQRRILSAFSEQASQAFAYLSPHEIALLTLYGDQKAHAEASIIEALRAPLLLEQLRVELGEKAIMAQLDEPVLREAQDAYTGYWQEYLRALSQNEAAKTHVQYTQFNYEARKKLLHANLGSETFRAERRNHPDLSIGQLLHLAELRFLYWTLEKAQKRTDPELLALVNADIEPELATADPPLDEVSRQDTIVALQNLIEREQTALAPIIEESASECFCPPVQTPILREPASGYPAPVSSAGVSVATVPRDGESRELSAPAPHKLSNDRQELHEIVGEPDFAQFVLGHQHDRPVVVLITKDDCTECIDVESHLQRFAAAYSNDVLFTRVNMSRRENKDIPRSEILWGPNGSRNSDLMIEQRHAQLLQVVAKPHVVVYMDHIPVRAWFASEPIIEDDMHRVLTAVIDFRTRRAYAPRRRSVQERLGLGERFPDLGE